MDDVLYRRLLGDAFAELPAPLQKMHDVRGRTTAHGTAKVERGRGPLVAAIGWVFGFPHSGDNVPLTVIFTPDGGREIWQRSFSGALFHSVQEMGRGRHALHLIERFGPFAFAMTARVKDRQLHLEVCGAWFWILPLPAMFHPKVEAFEHDDGDRFNFVVDLGLPVLGRLVRYTGWLEPVASTNGDTERQPL